MANNKELNASECEKISGGKNPMIIKEEQGFKRSLLGRLFKKFRKSDGPRTKVTYKCPKCGHTYNCTYIGMYATARGYPATSCPKCHTRYWGGEEI